jgi:HlyD family secretion protein
MTGHQLSVRRPVALGLGALALLAFGFGTWSVTARIEGAIVAHGRIEVEQDRQIVQHPDGGVVADILVHEGELVAAGGLLVRLDGAALRSELAIVSGQLTELHLRSARLQGERDSATAPDFPPDLLAQAATNPDIAARIAGENGLFQARRASLVERQMLLDQRVLQLQSEADGLIAQTRALAVERALIEADLADQQTLLAKGLTPAARVMALQREAARLDGDAGSLAAALAQVQGQITAVQIERGGLSTLRREEAAAELRDLGPMLLELTERHRALAERIARLEVRAPVSGIVLGLQVTTPRAVLRAADPILYLVPQDRPLIITARVSPMDIDALTVGQPADLVFPAFRDRDLPPVPGQVTRLSADALTDAQTGLTYFAADLTIDPTGLMTLGDRALLPGMPVEVFVKTGSRSPLGYLVQPLASYFSRALRESG